MYSKDVQGIPRTHTITTLGLGFDAVQNRYNFRPFSTFGQTAPRFYKLDPSRIRSIVVDSGACPCDGRGGRRPADDHAAERRRRPASASCRSPAPSASRT